MTTAIQSWGKLCAPEHECVPLIHPNTAANIISQACDVPAAAFGAGRSYGDVALNPDGKLWLTRGLDHFIDFDEETGKLTCEAGVLLRDIQRLVVPRGWMLPVTPGSQIVTLGGAIANDIHGKNHHVLGSFGAHVTELKLARTDGTVKLCGLATNPDWFAATLGGLGLTGIVLEATVQLRPVKTPWLDTESIPYYSLEEFFTLADESEVDWEYTVSWIDCMAGKSSRGIFMRANHGETAGKTLPKEKSITMPLTPPVSLVNGLSLRPFNFAYFHKNKWAAGKSIQHYEPFFYPLDNIHEWNRMYGKKGFYQYQSVVPNTDRVDVTQAMLDAIKASGQGSFLAVLKTFGDKPSEGMLSFPMEGVTLALDFPNRGAKSEALFKRLDAIVSEAGGRIYPAKDARMPRELFEAGYPRLKEFTAFRDEGISTAMSRRLLGS